MIPANILLVLFSIGMQYSNPDIHKMRVGYTSKNESEVKAILSQLNQIEHPSTLIIGYKGAMTMVLAKFQFNPYTKLKYFNDGKTVLEEAIAKDSKNLELIYLRYTIQYNAPTFLKYNSQLAVDREFLQLNVTKEKDLDLKNRIMQFLHSTNNSSAKKENIHN